MGNPRGMRRDFEALEKRRMAAVRLFPTDLNNSEIGRRLKICDQTVSRWRAQYRAGGESALRKAGRDRKSTRLNSSHVRISYAVFCLRKKKHRRITLESARCGRYAPLQIHHCL